MNKNNLWKRTLTGVILLAVMIGGTLWNAYSYTLVYGVIVLLCSMEYERLASLLCRHFVVLSEDTRIDNVCNMFFPLASLLVFLAGVVEKIQPTSQILGWFLPLFFLIFCILTLFLNRPLSPYSLLRLILSFFGMAYITFPFFSTISLVFKGNGEYGGKELLIVFCIIWLSDTGAYLCGSLCGSRRLFEKVSPKKSWEGSVGGLLCACIGVSLISLRYHALGWIELLIWCVWIVVFATLGDLFESSIKRYLGIKDSGNLLPGHGGMLDRFDAALFALPIAKILLDYWL